MGKLTSTIGIPIKLLNEAQVRPCSLLSTGFLRFLLCAEWIQFLLAGRDWLDRVSRPLTLSSQGHVVTLEITSGVVYRGKLLEGALDFWSF
jgi:hypothetical protein